ncbi:heavy-metal-associated domain-containing protein [Devosia psychrophila]|uniref:heavy-metal-associated domain-containing protein n=1 Tax=Devosia psychrophila TaxID=728005 RepID=UPI0009E60FCB
MTSSAKLTFAVAGLGCPGCVPAIENAVMRLPGILYVGVSLSGGTMTITPGPDFERERVITALAGLGYDVDGTRTDPLGGAVSCPCRERDSDQR